MPRPLTRSEYADLCRAIKEKKIEIINNFFLANTDVNVNTEFDPPIFYPLLFIACHLFNDAALILIDHGADVTKKIKKPETGELHTALEAAIFKTEISFKLIARILFEFRAKGLPLQMSQRTNERLLRIYLQCKMPALILDATIKQDMLLESAEKVRSICFRSTKKEACIPEKQDEPFFITILDIATKDSPEMQIVNHTQEVTNKRIKADQSRAFTL